MSPTRTRIRPQGRTGGKAPAPASNKKHDNNCPSMAAEAAIHELRTNVSNVPTNPHIPTAPHPWFLWFPWFLFPLSSFACTTPTGTAGDVFFNTTYKVMQYCNGTSWVNTGTAIPTATQSGCTTPSGPAGAVFYNSPTGVVQFCNGQHWVDTACAATRNPNGTGCSIPTAPAGTLFYETTRNELQYCDSTNWVAMGWPCNGGPVNTESCQTILASGGGTGNGVYSITPKGGTPISAYCDMTTDGGGWTMVAAQFEADPVTDWNEGLQPDYDPSLVTKKGFAFSSALIPSHTQTAFGQDLNPTFMEYVNYTYSTGNLALQTLVGQKTGHNYQIHRNTGTYYNAHNPEEHMYGAVDAWSNTLTIDRTGGKFFTWAFSPKQTTATSRGYAINGSDLQYSTESFGWTLWVR